MDTNVLTSEREAHTKYCHSRHSTSHLAVTFASIDSAASAEFVCAKAIKDGVIDAVIDHDNQQIRSKGVADVYSTNEPQKAFHRRIVFCLDVRNEAVKAMQYPPDTGKKKNVEEDDKEEKQTDEEIAKEIEEELGDELP